MSLKVIVTNQSALKGKYGPAGYKKIADALKRLTAADAKRHLQTRIIALDNASQLAGLKAKPVAKPTSELATKQAIDAVFKALEPAYLVILGAGDVVCQIKLGNPVNLDADPENDDDHQVPSDLPYACDTAFSRDVAQFLGPTRVVGRLPDIEGSDDPDYLVGLLDAAAAQKPRPRQDYMKAFAMTASVWRDSTEESVANIFGKGTTVHRSPPAGHPGINSALKARHWFLNCHGGSNDPKFYGEGPPKHFVTAMESAKVAGKLSADTVIAAECCYGAQLYDPALAGDDMGICNQALASGAIGFFGSSTIAYGPATGNGAADLIAQYFSMKILTGASLGRAALQARQQFIQRESMSDPVNLKTLAQFLLLGDPSLQPCEASQKTTKTVDGDVAVQRRRMLLNGLGKALQRAATFPMLEGRISAKAGAPLAKLARKFGYKLDQARSYRVSGGADIKSAMKATHYEERVVTLTKRAPRKTGAGNRFSVLVARLSGKSVISYTEYVSR